MPECIYKRLELGLLEHGIDTWWQYWFEFQAAKIHTYSIYSVRNGFRSNFVSEDRILQVGPQVNAQHSTNLVAQMNIVSISGFDGTPHQKCFCFLKEKEFLSRRLYDRRQTRFSFDRVILNLALNCRTQAC